MNRSGGFEVTVSCMVALTDFTVRAGATNVVPASHAWDDYDRKATPEETTQAVMPAGSGLIYTGRVLHGAGFDLTPELTAVPASNERSVERGRELVEVLELAALFPARHATTLEYPKFGPTSERARPLA